MATISGAGITTTNTGNVAVNGNSLDFIGAGGILISVATSDAVVQDNHLAHVTGNGIVVGPLLGSATITGNVLSSISGTGIAGAQFIGATVSNNSLSDIGQDGINLSQIAHLVVNANQMARVAGDGIDIALVQDVTVNGNLLSDVGQMAGAGVRLDNYTTATIIGNSIVNLTAAAGLTISNGASVPFLQGNATIAGNVISGNLVGIQTAGNVLGTISGNTIGNNSQWGILVGTGITQTHLEGFNYLNLLITGNLIANNGVPLDHTLATGGVRNDNIGMVLDARGNNWGDPSGPYAGPTHFNRPNPGGLGNAVTDWVQYDVLVAFNLPPMLPPFGSMLDNFARGPHPQTPGDVLAIGPAFTYNGALFDLYFVDVFGTAFSLAQVSGGGNFPINYGVCFLGDMWKTDACRLPPGSQP